MSTIRPLAATADTTMRPVVHDAYSSADVLHVVEIDRPQAAHDEVLLTVRAAGLDRGTWHLMTGKPYLLRLAFDITPGRIAPEGSTSRVPFGQFDRPMAISDGRP